MANCTLYENQGGENAGGIHCENNSNPVITNCILWGDMPQEMYTQSGSTPTVTYCDIQNGTGEWWFGAGCIDASG